ncbi:STAS domain-containing protein [Mucisphaera sp.]|uniref:STAS domain-containing protein n=1 Tax=Mucisphaera sp. TaxID=2913024 RepID=UPI003D097E6E
MSIQEWSAGIWLVTLSDDPSFVEVLDTLHVRLQKCEAVPHVVLDMSGVSHLNSSNLSQLLRLRKVVADHDSKLRLAAPPDSVWAVFIATGLDKVFEFATEPSTALAGLQLDEAGE